MKALKPTKFLAFLTLFALSSYSVASESVEIKLTYLPGQQAEYQNKVSGSIKLTAKQAIAKNNKLNTYSANSRFRLATTEADKDGNLPITVEALSAEVMVNGKNQTTELPKPQTVKQSPNGQLITDNKSVTEESLIYYLAPLDGFELPEKIVIGKKYPINYKKEAFNRVFADTLNGEIDYSHSVKTWIKIHKANEQFAWGQIDLTFKVSGKSKKQPMSLSGTRLAEFKYNRHTHLFEEVHDKTQYSVQSKGIKMAFTSDSRLELIKK